MPEIDLHHLVVLDEYKLLQGKVTDMSWENDPVLIIVDSSQDCFLHSVNLSDKKVSEYRYGKIGKKSKEFLLDRTVYPDMNNRPILFGMNKKGCFMMLNGYVALSIHIIGKGISSFCINSVWSYSAVR